MRARRVCILRVGWQPFIDEPLKNLIGGLAGRGIEVTLLKSRSRADLGLPEETHPKAACQIFPIFMKRFSKMPLLRPLILFLGWFEFLARCVARGMRARPGAVVAIDIDSLPAGWLAARLTGAALVYYSYELYTDRPGVPAKRFWDLLERIFIHRADFIVACEPNRARVLEERYGLRTRPMAVLNVPPRSEAPRRGDRIQRYLRERGAPFSKVLYFHGWINRTRCADRFIEALRAVRPDAGLFFVGPIEAAYKSELLALAQRCGVADRVVFAGVVPGEELMEFPASADIGLQTQLNVGLNSYYCAPIKLFQYFASGLPVVGSNFPGMIEIIEKNGAGLCVDPESEEAIAAAINRLLDDDSLRREMSANALRIAREKYCYEVEGKPLLDVIEGFLTPTKP